MSHPEIAVGDTVRCLGSWICKVKEIHECGAIRVAVFGTKEDGPFFWMGRAFIETENKGTK